MVTEIIVATIIIIIVSAVFAILKKTNQAINDYYPFDPRKPKI